ncbi:hypothetical protein GF342_04665 [Candidatus Woesearchaeota archaeon]|nr:hypothetical protein [Candidatus Woesearchaeota archaeon]
MVRSYLSRYVDAYVGQRPSLVQHFLSTVLLAFFVVVVLLVGFSLHLGLSLLLHSVVQVWSSSWIVWLVSSALTLSFFVYILFHGIYEVTMLIMFSWVKKHSWRTKFALTGVFLLDFLLSDFLIVVGGLLYAESLLGIGFGQSYLALSTVPLAFLYCFVGLFFQAVFLSAYGSTKHFSKVIDLGKKFILATEGLSEVKVSLRD